MNIESLYMRGSKLYEIRDDVMEDESTNFLYCFNCDDYVSDLTLEKYVEH